MRTCLANPVEADLKISLPSLLSCLKVSAGIAVCILFVIAGPASVEAQTSGSRQINSEWVEASSPLPGGGRVSTTYQPGSGTSPVTSVSQSLIRNQGTFRPAGGTFSSQRPQLATGNLTGAPLAVQAGAINPAAGSRQFGGSGLAPVRTANGTTLMPVVSYVPVSGSYYNPNALQNVGGVQQVQFQNPGVCRTPVAGTAPVLNTNSGVFAPIPGQTTNPATGGFFPTQPTRQTGNGYRALIPRPLPAGTYIGQGWLGQPKAYVNNQPLRNALRYLIIP